MATQNTNLALASYIRTPETLERFTDLLGANSRAYIQSVIIAAGSTDDLMKCTPQSIVRSALRAASLGLSCDPALKQAWLVPYNKNIGTRDNPQWVKEAQFQPHYKGLHTLAMRTGKYVIINVSPVYKGQRVMEDPLTGLHAVQDGNAFGQPAAYNSAYTIDVTLRRSKENERIGWLGYFKTIKGFQKSVWMSSIEIDDHARKYVKDYEKNPNWNDNEKRAVMEMKTVLKQLLSWADLSGVENLKLAEALKADTEEPIEGVVDDLPKQDAPAVMSYEYAVLVPIKISRGEKMMSDLVAEELNKVYLSEKTSQEQKDAAAVILKHDFNMDPPEVEKRAPEQIKKEMGF